MNINDLPVPPGSKKSNLDRLPTPPGSKKTKAETPAAEPKEKSWISKAADVLMVPERIRENSRKMREYELSEEGRAKQAEYNKSHPFETSFREQFNPLQAITKEGIIPQAIGYGKKLLSGEKFEKPKETPDVSVGEALKGLKNYAVTNPGGFVGVLANALVADPELLFLQPELFPARLYKTAQASGKLATTALKAADASTQAAAIAAAQDITKQLNETGTVNTSQTLRNVETGALLGGGTVLGLQGLKAGGVGSRKFFTGTVQPNIAEASRWLESKGFKLEPAQLRSDSAVKSPGFGAGNRQHNERLATELATEQTGYKTTNVTPQWVGGVKKKLGQSYDKIFNRDFDITFGDAKNFTTLRNFERSVYPAGSGKVSAAANNLIARWNKEYIDKLMATIKNNKGTGLDPKLVKRGISPVGIITSKGWRNVRNASATDAPVWAKDVENAINDIADKLGMKRPDIYFGSWGRRSESTYGQAWREGHMIVSDKIANANDAIATGLHEFGHTAEFLMFVNAPREEQRAVLEAFHNQMRETPVGKLTTEQHRPITANKYDPASRTAIDLRYEKNYLRNWHEWYAEQTSRWITQTQAPTNVVEKYFKKVADMWKQIYQRVTGYLPMRQEVANFYNSRWNRNTVEDMNPLMPTEKSFMEGEDPTLMVSPEEVTASINGSELQRLRSSISDIARTHPDGNIRRQAGAYVNLIDEMVEKSHPGLKSELQQTNRRYAAALTLEEGVRKGWGYGKVDLSALGDYLSGETYGFGSGTSTHPLYELGFYGRAANLIKRGAPEGLGKLSMTDALLGRGKAAAASLAGRRTQFARNLQRKYGELPGDVVPEPTIPSARYAPYLPSISQQASQAQFAEEAKRQEEYKKFLQRYFNR